MATPPTNKIELTLIKPLPNEEAQEFTLSLEADIRLAELTEYMRKEWKAMSDKEVFYTMTYGNNAYLSDQLTIGQIAQGQQSVRLFAMDRGSFETQKNKKCCSIF